LGLRRAVIALPGNRGSPDIRYGLYKTQRAKRIAARGGDKLEAKTLTDDVLASPATAASQRDWNHCKADSSSAADRVITGCTRILKRRGETAHNRAAAYYNRGNAYKAKGDFDRAIADYNEAVRLDPKDPDVYNNRGNAYDDKGDHDRAIADYNEAIRLNPNDSLAYFNRGLAYSRKGDLDRAIAGYDEAIRLDPKYVKAYINRGDAYADKGEFDRAIADYSEAIRLDPKDVASYNSRGDAFKAKDDLDRAIADYNEAIRINPKESDAYFHRGIANLYAGSLPKALADLNQMDELDPTANYGALWRDIVSRRSKLQSRLPQAVSQLDMTAWPAPVIRLFLGQMTPEAVLAAADDRDAYKKKVQVCEANFYSGEFALQRGVKEEAERRFRFAVAECPKRFVEWSAARAELTALGATP
jgi:lipoprotein NlpI